MAEEDDLDLGEAEGGASKKKLIIIGGLAALLLIGVGVAAWLLLGGDEEEAAGDEPPEAVEQAPAVPQGPVAYHALDPVFVANLAGRPRMLQVGIQLRFRYPELAAFLKHNDPMIRHGILNLLSVQDGKALKEREAKEKLRAELKEELNRMIQKYDGPGEIDEVFFSSFVMQ